MPKDVTGISFDRLHGELDSSIRRFWAADYCGLILFVCDATRGEVPYQLKVEYTDASGTESAYIEADLMGFMDVMHYDDAATWVVEQAGYDPGPVESSTRFLRAGANLL